MKFILIVYFYTYQSSNQPAFMGDYESLAACNRMAAVIRETSEPLGFETIEKTLCLEKGK